MPTATEIERSLERGQRDVFATTDWNLILSAASDSDGALDRLCRTYWRPVYMFVRASGAARPDAEDDTQEFFADMFKREWLKAARSDRGRFRAFMRTHLRNFLKNRRRDERTLKRGGAQILVPLDIEGMERELSIQLSDSTDPVVLYEKKWASTVLQSALLRLEREESKANRSLRFQTLRPFLIHPPVDGDYIRIGRQLDMPRGQVALLVHRLSRRFAALVRSEIAATVADPGEVQEELRHLLKSVSL
jgi:DNA-directed RNA polymerase specialized sigma24 family protein